MKSDDGEDMEVSYVRIGGQDALDRANLYLSNRVPAMIWTRLLVIHESGGDVKAATDELIDRIMAMSEKIV